MNTLAEFVVLTDTKGNDLGLMEKIEAHERGFLHKAFSVLLFNDKNEWLIQQRAKSKYHWPGVWSNTCCSHPRKGETFLQAAQRRLEEELGIQVPLEYKFDFIYRAQDKQTSLIEHEYDVVFFGRYNGEPSNNPKEVMDTKWISFTDLQEDISQDADKYSFWFKMIIDEIKKRKLFVLK